MSGRAAGLLGIVGGLVVIACAGSSDRSATPGRGAVGTSGADPAANAADGGIGFCSPDGKETAPCADECNRGIATGCSILAARVERGDGLPKDLTRAVSLHERACELREPAACLVAARMHAGGIGVSPSRTKQIELLVAACTLGEAAACAIPARAYAAGNGVTRDPNRARDLWERACVGGVSTACDAVADAGP